MALTKEERSQRAKQRIQERRENEEEMERNYPSALLNRHKEDMGEFLQVRLDSEEPPFLTIRFKGDWFYPDPGFSDVQKAFIRLDNPGALASLIRGLMVRYNAIVRDLNHEVENTPSMDTAKIFESNGVP
jgi:hypothetical protein